MSLPPSPGPSIAVFLDFVAWPESRGRYGAIYGDVDCREPDLVHMRVSDLLEWQARQRFSAAGRYQIIRKTLLSLVDECALSGGEIYDEALQDRLATALLRRRGLDAYLAGRMGAAAFALSVAHEWAALPGVLPPHFARSVYAGDGVNRALVGVGDYLRAVRALRATPARGS